MSGRALLASAALTLLPGASQSATGAQPPALVGTCAFTTVAWVGQRLYDPATRREVADTGSSVRLADGVMGVSYDQVEAVNRSRRGDRVMTCLAKLPTHCPPGDRRGRWYTTTNLRTDEAWTLPDAEHECGGA